jgi:hypothetical protein
MIGDWTMKRILLTLGALGALALPAQASSIVAIDEMITGAKGPSVIVLGPAEPSKPDVAPMITSSFDGLAKPGRKPINFTFARKYPDPAVPIPAPVTAEDGTEAAATPAAPAPAPVADAPPAPVDAGTIPAQKPVEQSELRPTRQGEALQEPGVPDGMQQINVAPPAKIISGS